MGVIFRSDHVLFWSCCFFIR